MEGAPALRVALYYLWVDRASHLVLQALEGESFRSLDAQKTLAQNGIEDQTDELKQLGLDEREFAPVLQLYFNDDLTEA